MVESDDGAFDLDAPPPPPGGPGGRAAARTPDAAAAGPGAGGGRGTGPAARRGPGRRVLLAGGVAVAAAVVIAAQVGRGEPVPPPPTPAEVLAVLATAPDADDELPDVGLEQPAVVAGSTRGLGVTEDARYWAAVDAEGRVCFLTLVDRVLPGFGASCAEPADVVARGVPMKLSVGGVVSDAVLVPDGFDTRALEAQGMVRASANLLVRDATSDF